MPSRTALIVLSLLSLATDRASSASYQPMTAIACRLEPAAATRRANGYDCAAAHAVRAGWVDVSAEDEDEALLRRNPAFYRLAQRAADACGADCRFFYGSFGYQCLAIAQSPYYTGLGSFMGRERTKADAERTALHDCEEFVGQPGQACRIIVSTCGGE